MNNKKDTSAKDREDDRKAMGERLREAREYLGFSQDQVAAFLKIPRSALSLIETGQRKVDALELKKLAGLYKRTVGHFTGEVETEIAIGSDVKHLARKVAGLSADDREELGRFADFLRARNQKKGG